MKRNTVFSIMMGSALAMALPCAYAQSGNGESDAAAQPAAAPAGHQWSDGHQRHDWHGAANETAGPSSEQHFFNFAGARDHRDGWQRGSQDHREMDVHVRGGQAANWGMRKAHRDVRSDHRDVRSDRRNMRSERWDNRSVRQDAWSEHHDWRSDHHDFRSEQRNPHTAHVGLRAGPHDFHYANAGDLRSGAQNLRVTDRATMRNNHQDRGWRSRMGDQQAWHQFTAANLASNAARDSKSRAVRRFTRLWAHSWW
ncbi:MAG: hypothetical protein ACRETB_09720 [Steroidobacteraceae bacterium]